MWLEWFGKDGAGWEGGLAVLDSTNALVGNFLCSLLDGACPQHWPSGSRRFPRKEKGEQRAFPFDQGHFGLAGAWHPGVGKRLTRSQKELGGTYLSAGTRSFM